MTDLPELFDLGDRVLLGPRPAAEVAAVIRMTTTLLSRAGSPALPRRITLLADHLERFAEPAARGTAALPQHDSSLPSTSPILLDPVSTGRPPGSTDAPTTPSGNDYDAEPLPDKGSRAAGGSNART
ncbi:hypothetical protein GS448_15830 [Rhodococcus hoagii]|nr:hypothetical protein [Prescottella equi]